MAGTMRGLLTPPFRPDAEDASRARMFHTVVWIIMSACTLCLCIVMAAQPQIWQRVLRTIAVLDGLGVLLLILSHRTSTRVVSTLLVGGLILLVTVNSLDAGGVRSPGVVSYYIFVLLAGLLMGMRAGVITAFLCGLLALGLLVAELTGHLPVQSLDYGPVARWALLCMYIILGLVVMYLATRALSQALQRVEQELRDRRFAEEHGRALEQQLRQSQKMEALGTLAGGIAHDFNNILGAIQGNLALAKEDIAASHPAAVSLDEIGMAAIRARALITRILIFSRRQETRRTPLDLAPVVAESVQLLKSTLPAKVQLQSYSEPSLPDVLADGTQILQIVLNLGTNASHAMRERGGVLNIELTAIRFDEPSSPPATDLAPGHYVQLSVKDHGDGMSAETLERIFEPFFTTKGTEGTGLGLSVVHGIVREHGGAITVDSAPGQGTIFRVFLPAHSA